MLNFDEEIKRFQPVLEVSDIEGRIAAENMDDLIDMMKVCLSNNTKMAKETIDKEL